MKQPSDNNVKGWGAGAVALWLMLPVGCQKPAPDYVMAKAQMGDVLEEVVASGTVSARTKVNVGSQISGTVHRVAVDIGAEVAQGDVLAQLDTRMLDAQLLRARATLTKARAQRQQAQLTRDNTERSLQRMQKLARDAMTARVDEDAATLAHAQADVALAVAEATVQEAEADVQTAAHQVVLATLRSPIEGVVIDRQIEVGQTVAAQFQVATLFTIAQDMARVVVHAAIDEADMGRVRVGMPVRFFVDAYPGRIFAGTLKILRPAPQAAVGAAPAEASSGGVVTYLAEIAADNADHALLQGMTVQVRITTAEHRHVVRVPAAALRFVPQPSTPLAHPEAQEASAGVTVWVLTAEGALQRRDVTVALSDGAFWEVTSGLSADESVAVGQGAGKSGGAGAKRARRGLL